MKTIALTAPTGMIGSAVYNVLKNKYHLVLIYRDDQKLNMLDAAYGDINLHKKIQFDLMDLYRDYCTGFPSSTIGPRAREFFEAVGTVDGFINCAGMTKAYSTKDPSMTLFLNSVLPRLLSGWYEEKLIHITTDCVFNGLEGAPYDEQSLKNPNDLYGLSKSIGEPSERSLILRTSTIGDELAEFVGLLAWFKSQQGNTVKGFRNHFWNGITSRQYGMICDAILSNRSAYPRAGLFHIFSNDISKYDMLCKFKEKYKLDLQIEPIEASPAIDRRLRTVYDLCDKLMIPSFETMLADI